MTPDTVKQLSRKVINHLLQHRFAYLYIVLWTVLVLAVVLNRWWQFENYYFDHGIFDQALWSAAQFKAPLIDHFDAKPINQFGDHFTPSHYLLIPLYWVTSAYEPLLVLGVLFVAASAIVLYLLSRTITKHTWLSFALLVAYTWYIGLQNTLIAGYHTELPALLSLSLALYCMQHKQWRWFWVLLILTLGFKETFATIGVGIGIYLLLTNVWRQGLAVIIVSVLYFLLVTQFIIPVISGNTYGYSGNLPIGPQLITELFDDPVKVRTQIISLATVSFLPLFGFAALPLVYQDFMTRFVISDGTGAWDLGMHYNAMLSLLLFFASIKGAELLLKIHLYRKLAVLHALLIIIVSVGIHHYLRGPLGLSYNPQFYAHTQTMSFLYDFVEAIPENVIVMTQNNLAPKIIHESARVMLLRDEYWQFMPEVIALDIRDGQSPNNYWPVSVNELHQKLIEDPNYTLESFSKEQVLFIRSSEPDMNYYLRYTPGAQTTEVTVPLLERDQP